MAELSHEVAVAESDEAQSILRRSWFARVSLVYWASRLLTVGIMLGFAWAQERTWYSGAHPDYLTFANFWDARWYAYIASAGYPTTLPLDAAGHVTQNAWAFLPVYPFLVGGLAVITGLGWSAMAVIVSLLAGWGFSLVLYSLMRPRLTAAQSTWAVVFACVAPASPLFGVGYAESLFLFFLALALWMLINRNYWMVAIILPVMAFTRPGAIAFALTIGGHWLLRWWHRKREPFDWPARLGVAALAFWSALLGVLWLGIAALVTGDWSAYTDTELSWRAAYIGYGELIPGTAWFQGANWWFGQPWTFILPIAALAVLALLLIIPAARTLQAEQRWWLGSYGAYLFMVFFPQSSSVRILAPMFSVSGLLAQIRSTIIKLIVVMAGIAGQFWWLHVAWSVVGSDWTPP